MPATKDSPLLHCNRCQTALYCGCDCQIMRWKSAKNGGGSHKKQCLQLQAQKVGKNEQKANSKSFDTARTELAEHDLAMVAGQAACVVNNPDINMSRDQRTMLQNFSRKMESVLTLGSEAKYEWMLNPENNKESVDVKLALLDRDAEA